MVTIYLREPVQVSGTGKATFGVSGKYLKSESGVAYLKDDKHAEPNFAVPWDNIGFIDYRVVR